MAPATTNTAETQGLARAFRPARALLGWMRADQAALTQAGRNQSAVTDEHRQLADAARAAVARRSEGVSQTDLLSDPPAELDEHIEALQQNPGSAAYFAEGWVVKVANLAQVCGIQPTIFTDAAEERARDVDPEDLKGIAEVSLPIPQPVELPAQFDESRQAWMFSSRNPNLRITGQFGGQIQPGVVGFGFLVAVTPSFMQVASLKSRYLLRDGYHRAYGLLRKGISQVPIFYRDYPTFEDLHLSQGMLPQDSYLGSRPARLIDYLDDEVAADVELPASQKMIVIQGIEISPLG